MTWTHKFEKTHRVGRERTTVTAGLHYLAGNERPYFSVTCAVDEQAGNGRWMESSGGADREAILAEFPELAPVVALHLSDDRGVPMHAVANGVYWLKERKLATFARQLRLSHAEAVEARDYIAAAVLDGRDAQAELSWWLDRGTGILKRWQAEADAAIVLLDTLAGETP